MRTVGIDLSSQPAKTAACAIEWRSGAALVSKVIRGVDDERALSLMRTADKVGIDIPLGWPEAFAVAVGLHASGKPWAADYVHADSARFRYRRTDLAVIALGARPLSVSSDRIAIPAMRAAALLGSMSPRPPRDGGGLVVEVYPALALRRWALPSQGYKGRERKTERSELVGAFLALTPWLEISDEATHLCQASDDAFDALIAAVVARAVAIGAVQPIPASERVAAQNEGWIAIPDSDSLERLAG